jgi:hypothetical protein
LCCTVTTSRKDPTAARACRQRRRFGPFLKDMRKKAENLQTNSLCPRLAAPIGGDHCKGRVPGKARRWANAGEPGAG